MLSHRSLLGVLAAAGAMLLPSASLSTRRIVVHQARLVKERSRRPERNPAVLTAGDLSAISKAEAKRKRKAAARLARGH